MFLSSIYFGGGTPTTLTDALLKDVLDGIKAHHDVPHDVSLCIEANPEDITMERAQQLKHLGFNRVSLGVQTFHDRYLKFLGRVHDSARARAAYDDLRNAGIKDINVDMMYGFPKQTRDELRQDLETVVSLNSEHVSIYTLTVEPHSRFHVQPIALDHPEKLAEDYVYVTDFLEAHGLRQYEVSNFAKHGFESRHNLVYWQGGDYMGVGMGAHGLSGLRRYSNEDRLQTYLEGMRSQGKAVKEEEHLTPQTRLAELLIFGLRMNGGVNLDEIQRMTGAQLTLAQKQNIVYLCEHGLMQKQGERMTITKQGRVVLDEIACKLL